MIIGTRIRLIRQEKGLSQGDLEKRTGIKRAYTSRVEHGFTVPSLETLERVARGLGVPMYRLFYDGSERCKARPTSGKVVDGLSAIDQAYWKRICRNCERMSESDRQLLLSVAARMARRKR